MKTLRIHNARNPGRTDEEAFEWMAESKELALIIVTCLTVLFLGGCVSTAGMTTEELTAHNQAQNQAWI